MATRRKYRTTKPQAYRDGGRVELGRVADDPVPSFKDEAAADLAADRLQREAEALQHQPVSAPIAPADDGNALQKALAAQRRAEELRRQPRPQAPELPASAVDWLSRHPEFAHDPVLNDRLGAVHHYVIKVDGIEPFTPRYFDSVESKLGLKAAALPPAAAPARAAPEPPRRNLPMSAPVSREIPMTSGQRQTGRETLSRDEVEIAHSSFPHLPREQAERQYLENRRKMFAMKADGRIQG